MENPVNGEPVRPQPDSGRPSYVPALKVALVVSLGVLIASIAMRFSRNKPEAVNTSGPMSTQEQEAEPVPASPAFQTTARVLPGRRDAPARAPDPGSVAPKVAGASAASELWSAVAPPAEAGQFVTGRLPELRFCSGGVEPIYAPPVFFKLSAQYSEELGEDYGRIVEATNTLGKYEKELSSLMAGINQDRQDYLRHARYADARRKAEGEAVMKQLVDLQTLYVERKRQFELESASLKPRLQDPPDVFDRKLPLYEAAANRFARDISQLESAILAVQKQILATVQTLRADEQNIDTALDQVAQEAIGRLHSISNNAYRNLGEVNGLIRNYNAKIERYGSPSHSPR